MQFCQETNTRVCPAKAEIAQAHLGRVLIKASAEPLQGVSALPPKSGGAASPLEGPLCARSGHQSELAAGSGCHLADQVRTRLLTSSASWYSLTLWQNEKRKRCRGRYGSCRPAPDRHRP